MLQFLPSKLCTFTERGVVYYHFAHCVNASKTSDQINGWHYRIENVIKQLVHESAVRSSRYEALGKFREHLRIFCVLQTSHVLYISMNAR